MLSKFISLITIIFILSPINISFSQTPENFIKDVTTKASEILKKNIDKSQKSEELIELAKQSVDIKGIGRYTLGRHKKSITNDQLIEYEILFNQYFLKSFSSRLSEYSDPKINVLNQKYLNDKYTMVSSILVGDDKRPEIKIEWRVYTKDPDKLLIRDLIIEGLSLARTQREEFNSVIQGADGNINILFDNLRNFNNS
tara:strand:+ start:166 stop:759 length:594 start_codon:yes stop_codon:yes gene_type:complete